MSSEVRSSLLSTYMSIPDPLESYDAQARTMFPWRSFINRFVLFTIILAGNISRIIQTRILAFSLYLRWLAVRQLNVAVVLLQKWAISHNALAIPSYWLQYADLLKWTKRCRQVYYSSYISFRIIIYCLSVSYEMFVWRLVVYHFTALLLIGIHPS